MSAKSRGQEVPSYTKGWNGCVRKWAVGLSPWSWKRLGTLLAQTLFPCSVVVAYPPSRSASFLLWLCFKFNLPSFPPRECAWMWPCPHSAVHLSVPESQISPTIPAVAHNQVPAGYCATLTGGQVVTRKNTLELGKLQRSAITMIKGLGCLPPEEPRADPNLSSLKRGNEKDKRNLQTHEPLVRRHVEHNCPMFHVKNKVREIPLNCGRFRAIGSGISLLFCT